MTSLEFIQKEIESYKIIKIGVVAMLKEPNRTEATISFLKNDLKEYEEKINHLQQIKVELKALEVIKEELQLVDKTTNQYGEPLYRYELNVVGQDKINTLEKEMTKKVEIRQRNSLSEPYFVCPTCHKRLDNEDEYCPYCKQKLDYSSYYGDEDEQ